ncbi:hypothetical protein G8770_06610 [Aestuariicella hydrocarbonica]|uniref:Uncharacterized protein n=1 Tax=Pseudomaricurvus hydrocarbonicus TaxID=1470433 RepID=A0A9E5MLQ8_9GAMM|nr:hypothetical protein [Aestuariicella hydrocarbonica]NHO65213.1 hypothetical protein [Aestuariicella hydrocarbonica]
MKVERVMRWPLIMVFCLVATVMFVYEFIKEWLFDGSLSPWQSHAITIVVTSFLATFAACLLRSWSNKLLLQQQTLELERQKAVSMRLMLSATQHIVNNLLNQFQLIQLEAEQGEVKQETLDLLERSVAEAKEQIRLLESIDDPARKESYDRFYPEKNAVAE